MAIEYRFDPEVYIPASIRYGYITLPEARAEYSRLRSAAVKRLKRLSRTEGRLYSAYRMYGKEGFTPLPKDATPAEVGRALADVYHFLEMKTSVSSSRDTLLVLHSSKTARNVATTSERLRLPRNRFKSRSLPRSSSFRSRSAAFFATG